MVDLPTLIPDVEVLLALEPEELGDVILQIFRDRPNALLSPGIVVSQVWPTHSYGEGRYPGSSRQDVELAVAEAFAWLQAQGLVIRSPGPNGSNGYSVLS